MADKTEPKQDVVNMRCRGSNKKCTSMQAVIIKVGGVEHAGQRMYRCVKCNHTWGLQMGGHLNI